MRAWNARTVLANAIRASGLEIVAPEELGGFTRLKGPTAEGLMKGFFVGKGNFAFSVAVVSQETDATRLY